MNNIHAILKQYWGYDQFRPLQEQIIQSVLNGHDTLALLPTGGGKSICFQVPALAKDGICIVVSPLIALMQDQVEQLKRRGIAAVAITSALSKKETDIAFDNCVYGKVKFLYLSPERLQTELARVRISKMNVNLIAVDEAHCISQWGYDFRPPYLQIAELRELKPEVPVMALTATATPLVVKDIQQQLKFKTENVLKAGFGRDNLAYIARKTEDKYGELLKLAKKVNACGVVYVRSRKKTQEIAYYLHQNGISATFYHAGLKAEDRKQRQQAWIKNQVAVMVSTNAFGMGIDKPDVRYVAHMDIPDSPEAYFQEAGRAGRDGISSGAVLFWNNTDIKELESRTESAFPALEEIRRVYQALANRYEIPVGSGAGLTVVFDIQEFCKVYKLDPLITFNTLKLLEREGYIAMDEAVFQPSKVYIPCSKEEIYRFEVANAYYEPLIKNLLRMYSGLFDGFVKISEKDIALRIQNTEAQVVKMLKELDKHNIVSYVPQSDKPHLTFLLARAEAKHLMIDVQQLRERKQIAEEKISAMKSFVLNETQCRQSILLNYFGETDAADCGKCDNCKKQQAKQQKLDRLRMADDIHDIIAASPMTFDDLKSLLHQHQPEEITRAVRVLLDDGRIRFNLLKKLESTQKSNG